MCRSRPSLSSDVWVQWLVVFLSEDQILLCVGHDCELIPTFVRNVRVDLNILGTKSLLCFSLCLLEGILNVDFISEIKFQSPDQVWSFSKE